MPSSAAIRPQADFETRVPASPRPRTPCPLPYRHGSVPRCMHDVHYLVGVVPPRVACTMSTALSAWFHLASARTKPCTRRIRHPIHAGAFTNRRLAVTRNKKRPEA